MRYDSKPLVADIRRLVADNDLTEADNAVDSLIDLLDRKETEVEAADARAVLDALRGKRQFDPMIRLAEALGRSGLRHERVRRLHAQALIDSGRFDEAEQVLKALLADVEPGSGEYKEAYGLLGRTTKQRYVDGLAATAPGGAAAVMQQSIADYGAIVAERNNPGDDHWHWINFIALTARARRDGLDPGHPLTVDALADELIAALAPKATLMERSEKEDIWLLASLGEAYVAKGNWAAAREVYSRYAASDNPGVNTFEVFSSLRQLVEVWGLGRTGPGSEVVAVLEKRLSDLMAKGVTLGPADLARLAALGEALGEGAAAPAEPEGATPAAEADGSRPQHAGLSAAERAELAPHVSTLVTLDWVMRGARPLLATAKIVHRHMQDLLGTGFLVLGRDLHQSLGDEVLLLTNSHVVGHLSGKGLKPALASAMFMSGPGQPPTVVKCREVLWESHMSLLDASLVRLETIPPGRMPVEICDLDSFPHDYSDLIEEYRRCMFVGIGGAHELCCTREPSGIVDLGYADAGRPHHVYLHHEAPTRDGSSGSPILDEGWSVIALHRAGTDPGRTIPRLGGRLGSRETRVAVALKSIAAQIALDLGDRARFDALFPGSSAAPATSAAVIAASSHPTLRVPRTEEQVRQAFASHEAPLEQLEELLEEATGRSEPFAPAMRVNEPVSADGTAAQGFREGALVFLAEGASSLFQARRVWGFKPRTPQETGLTLLSIGDSWFQFPIPRVKDTIDHLRRNHAVFCLSVAGAELGRIATRVGSEVVPLVTQHRPDGVLLSGGGNDLLGWGGIANHVERWRDGRSVDDLLNHEQLGRTLDTIVHYYQRSISQLLEVDPGLRIFCHGYDWALPNRDGGRWLHEPMKQLGIESLVLQREIVRRLIDIFNERMQGLEKQFPGRVHFVDCRGAVGVHRNSWYDELHPLTPGFQRVASRFNRRIADAFAGDPRVIGIA